ncbi:MULTISPECIES: M56 family metallopeptidase [unclassified Arthrobacter]|uniref:M56 family metallopeptidase n=1 Tax=unclassified Arthrobacter TaxID=235627 RepID=UPI0014930ED9|nr:MULTISPECIES: M56 family metallopeptidase [unclassified Arthrobacter]MBE0009555.1 M56 family peptidase [Arthrobacter sp. AET 35A]NOJ63305.1 M56 family metallopeptidase [Arthrobacter sp. 147(2020)]
MFWAAHLLAGLAVVLAWPAPVALSRAKWPTRAPATAMILWQAIALAGGLSMIGAMLVWGLDPLGDNLVEALGRLGTMAISNEPAAELGLVHVFALSAAGLLSAHLIFTLLLTYAKIQGQRRRHRDMLNLLSSPAANRPATLVINHPTPVAYCLPGGARSVTVLSDGLLDLLTAQELDAVLVHERAHLHQRHHLLLWAFAAWRSALPWLPTSQLAQRAVNELIEMLADDEALKTVREPVLARAIAIVASGPLADSDGVYPSDALSTTTLTPGSPSGQDTGSTVNRIHRLLTPQPTLSPVQQGAALGTSGLLLVAPTLLLIAPWVLG